MKYSLDKYLLAILSLFGVASFLSIAAANVFLGLSVLLFVVALLKKKEDRISLDDVNYLF